MILVIADDISGAAELASLAYARGLRAEVQTAFNPATDAQVVALDTDTRSLPGDQAANVLERLTPEVEAAKPRWVYKKTDSVLRGPVRAEISALLAAGRWQRAVLVPANPSRGRLVRRGRYFIHDVPLENTVFRNDPEYPARTSSVAELIRRSAGAEVHVLRSGDPWPEHGLIIPQITSADDLACQAAMLDDQTLAAGAADFFAASLTTRGALKVEDVISAQPALPFQTSRCLFVCGSAAAWPQRRAACAASARPCFALPEQALRSPFRSEPARSALQAWAARIAHALERSRGVVAGVGDSPATAGRSGAELLEMLSAGMANVLAATQPDYLFLEGGATARAVLDRLGWRRLRVSAHIGHGFGALTPEAPAGPQIVIKPGSYDWPAEIWND